MPECFPVLRGEFFRWRCVLADWQLEILRKREDVKNGGRNYVTAGYEDFPGRRKQQGNGKRVKGG